MNYNLQKLKLTRSTNIVNSVKDKSTSDTTNLATCGFVYDGKFIWTVNESILRVVSVESGTEIAYYNFAKHHGTRGAAICCVEEVPYLEGACILAIGIAFTSGVGSVGMLSIFSVQGSKILGSMDIIERITCLRYIGCELPHRVLAKYTGTLAIGTEQGKLFLVDLMLPKKVHQILRSPSFDTEIFPMYNVKIEEGLENIYALHKRAIVNRGKGDKYYFTMQFKEALDDSGMILSILPMPEANLMAIGLDDGRMVLYNLVELEAFHLAYPPGNRSPLTHMSYITPSDDPRAVVYIWAMHATAEGPIAVLHSVVFDSNHNGKYQGFRSCSARLTIPIDVKEAFPISCLSISKPVNESNDDDDEMKICILSFSAPTKKKSFIMVFDLNQWYKAQMPSWGDWKTPLKYGLFFEIPQTAMDISCDQNLLMPFDSVDRPEEHFLPTSLSFSLKAADVSQFSTYHRCGIQMQALERFKNVGPIMILNPSLYFEEMLKATIIPQFYDINFNMNTPIDLKREFLLSVALDYNHVGFLRSCGRAWYDGAMLGDDVVSGVSLSTLTDWIWNRVRAIKEYANELSKPLFNYSSQRIDCGTQKQLSLCYRQLKILSDLMQSVMNDYQERIPPEIREMLSIQATTIRMAAEYQEVLQWLLNVGLLPEGRDENIDTAPDRDDGFMIVPYPYRMIRAKYEAQRKKLSADGKDSLLFIDTFIKKECGGGNLKEVWGSMYPPSSIQSLLRTLLVDKISMENKCVIFIYLFMDMSSILNKTPYSTIAKNLIKFPTVFKINSTMIKRTQAFWNLDNGNLGVAVDEIISPLANDRSLPRWNRELLLKVLLKCGAYTLALKALRCPGIQIDPFLEMEILLANGLLSEALLVQRRSGDRELLEKFFFQVINAPNYTQLLDLTLTEGEGNVLRELLENSELRNDPKNINLHFVFLLQRSKFNDATDLLKRMNQTGNNYNMEPTKQVLSAFYSTIDNTTKKLTTMPAEDIPALDYAVPLSNNLIRAKCNAANDTFQQCVRSIHNAVYDSRVSPRKTPEMPFIDSPKLGIFEYRQGVVPKAQKVIYPDDKEINEQGKRRLPNEKNVLNILLDGPDNKRRRKDEKAITTSFIDKRIQTLTRFRNANPRIPSRQVTPSTPIRTPQYDAFNFLATPIVKERTPPPSIPSCPATPHSILKTRSNRGSVSPSRFSEIDDNRSVKSITFAMPNTRESSQQDSSYLEESFDTSAANDQPMDTSENELFYSPEKYTPHEPESDANIENIPTDTQKTNETSSTSSPVPPHHEEVLKSSESESENDDSEISSSQKDSREYGFARKSILNYVDDDTRSDTDSEMGIEEQYEEVELPNHSDDDDNETVSSDGSDEYGDINLADTSEDSSGSYERQVTKQIENEVIEIPDSDSDVEETKESSPSPEVSEIQSPSYEQHIAEVPFVTEADSNIPSSSVEPQIFEAENLPPEEDVMVEAVFDDMGNLQNVEELSKNDKEEITSPTFTEQQQIIEEITPSASLPQELIETPIEEKENVTEIKSAEQELIEEVIEKPESEAKETQEPVTIEQEENSNDYQPQKICSMETDPYVPSSQETDRNSEAARYDSVDDEVSEMHQFEILPPQQEDEEIQKILDNALEPEEDTASQSQAETKPPKSAKKTRAPKRASSVPINALTPPKKSGRTSRAASELRALNESIEQFEGVLTRKKSQLLRSRESTPVTPRLVSNEELNVTPRRMATRAYSRDSVDSAETPEKTASTKKRSVRKKANETLKDAESPESKNETLWARRSTRANSTSVQSDDSEASLTRIGRKRSTPKRFGEYEEASGRGAKVANKTKAAHETSQLSSIPEEDANTSRRGGRKKINFK